LYQVAYVKKLKGYMGRVGDLLLRSHARLDIQGANEGATNQEVAMPWHLECQ
jgi:hypothetical protein